MMRERERVVVWHARPTKGGSSKPAQRESGTLYVVCMHRHYRVHVAERLTSSQLVGGTEASPCSWAEVPTDSSPWAQWVGERGWTVWGPSVRVSVCPAPSPQVVGYGRS